MGPVRCGHSRCIGLNAADAQTYPDKTIKFIVRTRLGRRSMRAHA
jgi:hypothetical protein